MDAPALTFTDYSHSAVSKLHLSLLMQWQASLSNNSRKCTAFVAKVNTLSLLLLLLKVIPLNNTWTLFFPTWSLWEFYILQRRFDLRGNEYNNAFCCSVLCLKGCSHCVHRMSCNRRGSTRVFWPHYFHPYYNSVTRWILSFCSLEIQELLLLFFFSFYPDTAAKV